MKMKFLMYSTTLIVIMMLAACSWQAQSPDVSDPNTISTVAMQTVQAMMTEQAFATLVAEATQIAPLPTDALPNPTDTSVVQTEVPTEPTRTSVAVTNTPVPTQLPPTITPTPSTFDKAGFEKDVSIPDGTVVDSGSKFTKTWRLKNTGTTTWTTSYDLVFVNGNAMGAPAAIDVQKPVQPGETVDFSIEFKAPDKSGAYKGYWMLRNESGKLFGLGNNADQTFWVSIVVDDYRSDDVPTVKYDFDFAAKICSATWEGSFDKIAYPCNQDNYNSNAWVAIEMNPKFENGYQDDERTIVMHLSGKKDSWIQGFYPEVEIQPGHHFQTIIGCLDGNTTCDSVVSLDIKVDGTIKNLGKWTETYDKKITSLDIDLSAYNGKKVQLILGISNRSETTSNIFWLAPRLVK